MNKKGKLALVTGLTLARFPLIVLFFGLAIANYYRPSALLFAAALLAMLASGLTDLFDGLLARKFAVTTVFGAHMDPLMDKLFYVIVFPVLILLSASLPGERAHSVFLTVMAAAFLSRDMWVTFLRSMGSLFGESGKAGWSGKVRTAYTFPMLAAVYVYLAAPCRFVPLAVVLAAEVVGFVINGLSIVDYSLRYRSAMCRALEHEG